ncbi:TPA: STAS-like domain-containing protein [Serratia marcescens]|nr:STAS-like domain-containing protein [Serratia marcescens]
MKVTNINIAEQFSDMPYGRYEIDGPDNGERFRTEILYPAFLDSEIVNVYMDGALGYGSSFLDEAFAGLYRSNGITKEDIRRKLKLHCSLDYIVKSTWQYIDEAKMDK